MSRTFSHLTTLAGYVHWKLTGQKVLGVGEASGMFPIDSKTNDYDARMIELFNERLEAEKIPWKLQDILPKVLVRGRCRRRSHRRRRKAARSHGTTAGGHPALPARGRRRHRHGRDQQRGRANRQCLRRHIRLCHDRSGKGAVEGIPRDRHGDDAHRQAGRHGAQQQLHLRPQCLGRPVPGIHPGAWRGDRVNPGCLKCCIKRRSTGDADGGGLLAYNYVSGEHITHLEEGRPLFVRTPESRFTLANFMRVHLFSALGALKIGLDILFEQEQVKIDQILGHGGFFKTKEVGQKIMAAAMNVPVSVMETAGEGGAWGIALLAAYMLHKATNEPLEAYLSNKVFAGENGTTIAPDPRDVEGFAAFMERYKKGLVIERAAVDGAER